MSTDYQGDPDKNPLSIPIPDDGDKDEAASFDVAIEGLADRTAFLLERIEHVPLNQPYELNNFAESASGDSGASWGWRQSSTGGGADFSLWYINVPTKSKLTTVIVHFEGNYVAVNGAHAGEIGTKPLVRLYSQEVGQSVAVEGEQIYPWVDVSTYDSGDTIKLTGLSVSGEDGKAVLVFVAGEGGANALADAFRVMDIVYKLEGINA